MSEHLSRHSTFHSPAISIPPESLQRSVALLRALNHEMRQDIIRLLYTKDALTVTDIFVNLRVEQSVVSQHLAILRKVDLVQSQRDGKYIYYKLDRNRLSTVLSLMRQLGS